MNFETLLEDMVSIVAMTKDVHETISFSNLQMDPVEIQHGCLFVLTWLRAQSIPLRIKPIQLSAFAGGKFCRKLVNESACANEIFQVKDDKLTFAENISIEQALQMMLYAKENYNPPLLR